MIKYNFATPFCLLVLLTFNLHSLGAVPGMGFDRDDFLIAGFNSDAIYVYDHDFTYKGTLDDNFPQVTGLDFDAHGNLVAVGQSRQVRTYDAAGNRLSSFASDEINLAIDIKVGPNGNYYTATQFNGIWEFSPDGSWSTQLASGQFIGLAVLPGDVLWGGFLQNRPFVDVFDTTTRAYATSLPLDNGQERASSLFYSQSTDTVLMASTYYYDGVFERDTNGQFLREFTAPDFHSSTGVTRGPDGDVFATDSSDDRVYRWKADGTFVGVIDLTTSGIHSPTNILWAGNIIPQPIPEPTAITIAALAGALLLSFRWKCTGERYARRSHEGLPYNSA